MRLWHQALIPRLDRQRLLAQHRECCALRGAGWGKKHATVDYVFATAPERLIAYHFLVMDEMTNRGFRVTREWRDIDYRGRSGATWPTPVADSTVWYYRFGKCEVYIEHNEDYLKECIAILNKKGATLLPRREA